MIELEELAASQWGMFTTAQAQGLGVRRNQISRMADAGKVESAGYGAYRFTAGDETDSADIKAAWLSVYPRESVYDRLKKQPYDAIVAGRTAASMHGIGDFYASPYTFAVSQRKQTNRKDMRYLLRAVGESDIVFIDDLPTTSIERTVYDLIKSHEDPDLVDKFMSDASRKKGHVFDRARLSELLAPLAFKNGFDRHDGESFAADLVSRNAADIQIENAGKMLAQTFASIYSQDELQHMQDRIQKALDQLIPADVFKSSQRAAGQALVSIGDTMKKLAEALKAAVPPVIIDVPSDIVALQAAAADALKDSDHWNQMADRPSIATMNRNPEEDCGEEPERGDNGNE